AHLRGSRDRRRRALGELSRGAARPNQSGAAGAVEREAGVPAALEVRIRHGRDRDPVSANYGVRPQFARARRGRFLDAERRRERLSRAVARHTHRSYHPQSREENMNSAPEKQNYDAGLPSSNAPFNLCVRYGDLIFISGLPPFDEAYSAALREAREKGLPIPPFPNPPFEQQVRLGMDH